MNATTYKRSVHFDSDLGNLTSDLDEFASGKVPDLDYASLTAADADLTGQTDS